MRGTRPTGRRCAAENALTEIMSHRILLVDDEPDILEFVKYTLVKEGYEVFTAQNGAEALKAAAQHRPHLILLDMMMPVMDGAQTCRAIREDPQLRDTMVVFLSALGEEEQQLAGFGVGADDYLTKPFGTAELLARVRTAIRHTRTTSANSEIAREGTYTVGEMTIDYNKHQVLVRGENVHLTLSEFRIVALLGKFAGKVLTYDYIIKELWGPRAGGDNQILRVNMANIRRKIEKNPAEPEYLFTEVGVGYRMAENTDN